jgi:hypothetical protein
LPAATGLPRRFKTWGEDAEQLWTKAKEIEAQLPIRKRAAFAELKRRFPQTKYLKFGSLAVAARQGRLDGELASVVAEYMTEFDALEGEAHRCRIESDRLYKEEAAADKRKVLDPAADPIPAGEYPKLRALLDLSTSTELQLRRERRSPLGPLRVHEVRRQQVHPRPSTVVLRCTEIVRHALVGPSRRRRQPA